MEDGFCLANPRRGVRLPSTALLIWVTIAGFFANSARTCVALTVLPNSPQVARTSLSKAFTFGGFGVISTAFPRGKEMASGVSIVSKKGCNSPGFGVGAGLGLGVGFLLRPLSSESGTLAKVDWGKSVTVAVAVIAIRSAIVRVG